jgi:hypothetical protein
VFAPSPAPEGLLSLVRGAGYAPVADGRADLSEVEAAFNAMAAEILNLKGQMAELGRRGGAGSRGRARGRAGPYNNNGYTNGGQTQHSNSGYNSGGQNGGYNSGGQNGGYNNGGQNGGYNNGGQNNSHNNGGQHQNSYNNGGYNNNARYGYNGRRGGRAYGAGGEPENEEPLNA